MDGVKVAFGNRGMTVATMRERPERVESPGTYVIEPLTAQLSSIWAKGCILMTVYMFYLT